MSILLAGYNLGGEDLLQNLRHAEAIVLVRAVIPNRQRRDRPKIADTVGYSFGSVSRVARMSS